MNERQHTVAYHVARMKERILDLIERGDVDADPRSLEALARQCQDWYPGVNEASVLESALILIDEWLQAGRPLSHNWQEPSSRWAGTGATVTVTAIRQSAKYYLTGEYNVYAYVNGLAAVLGYVWADRYGWNARTEHRVIGRSVANRLKTRKAAVELLVAHVGDTTAPVACV